jgi:hypothetical protein
LVSLAFPDSVELSKNVVPFGPCLHAPHARSRTAAACLTGTLEWGRCMLACSAAPSR